MADKLVMLRPVVSQLDTRTARQLPTAVGFGDARRGSAADRGYGWQWVKLRRQVMARDRWLCQVCARQGIVTPADEVDHVINRAQGGTDDPGNLQAICRPCHRDKTQREARGGAGADVVPTR